MPDNTKLNAAIDAAESTALGGDSTGELANERALAIDAYSGRNLEPAPEGRSQVTDWTVFETIQWILPSLIRIFAGNGDNVVEFSPTGPDDEEMAEQESEFLNYLVTQKNNWFLFLLTWFQDALLTKNAYALTFMEEKLNTETQMYKGQSEESLNLLLEEEGVEIVDGSSYPDPEAEPTYVDAASGQQIDPQLVPLAPAQGIQVVEVPPRNLYDVSIRKTTPTKKLQFRVLPPENCKIGAETPDFTTERCDYFEYFEDVTISSLRAQGYDIEDDIASESDEDSMEEDARDQFTDENEGDSPDPSMRIVRARTIWIRYDYDEDGIAELQKVVRVGKEVLSREEAARIPVASIVPFINTHRHIGASVADLTFDLQRIKTKMLRGGLDSLEASANPGHAISSKVNLSDMLVNRPNRIVRMKDDAVPAEGHIMPLVTEFTLPQTLEGLRHMDTVVESRVGVNRIFQGIDDSSLNDHNRIGQLSTMAAQRVEQIARIFANGVEYLFSLAHELIIKSGHQAETTKLRGQWVTIDPSQWRTGRDMRVVAPFAAGNKDTLVQRLMMIMQVQEKALMGGLPIVTPDDAYATAIEMVKASDFNAPEKFFTDPQMIPPKEPPPDYTMMALEVERQKADNQANDTQVDAEVDKYKTDVAAQVDKYKADLNAELQVLLAQLKTGGTVDTERVKAALRDAPILDANKSIQSTGQAVQSLNQQLAQSIAEITSVVQELKDASDSPREVVRDEKGKVTGVKVNGKTRPIQRDADGKVIGV
jgi:hypothetical protein